MKRWLGVFGLCLVVLAAFRVAWDAWATNQGFYGAAGAANFTRRCSFDGKSAQRVTTSGTQAFTTAAVGNAQVRIVCNQDAHFTEGLSGVTGPTATTGDTFIPKSVPEYVVAPGNTYFGFIQDSAGGSCFVTECN